MNKGKKLYEGKAKILYETRDKDLIFLAIVKCAYIVDGKPVRIPEEIKDTLKDIFK